MNKFYATTKAKSEEKYENSKEARLQCCSKQEAIRQSLQSSGSKESGGRVGDWHYERRQGRVIYLYESVPRANRGRLRTRFPIRSIQSKDCSMPMESGKSTALQWDTLFEVWFGYAHEPHWVLIEWWKVKLFQVGSTEPASRCGVWTPP